MVFESFEYIKIRENKENPKLLQLSKTDSGSFSFEKYKKIHIFADVI